MLVEVIVGRHPIFQRQDYNIFSTVPVSFPVAALGGEVLIDTVDGKVVYDVKPGTQTDTRIRLKGKGVPNLRKQGRARRPLCDFGGPGSGPSLRGGEGTSAQI